MTLDIQQENAVRAALQHTGTPRRPTEPAAILAKMMNGLTPPVAAALIEPGRDLVLALKGSAGSGKTQVVREIVNELVRRDWHGVSFADAKVLQRSRPNGAERPNRLDEWSEGDRDYNPEGAPEVCLEGAEDHELEEHPEDRGSRGRRFLVLAFTNRAVGVLRQRGIVGAMTIHRGCMVPVAQAAKLKELREKLQKLLDSFLPGTATTEQQIAVTALQREIDEFDQFEAAPNDTALARYADLLIIDEASMVPAHLWVVLIGMGVPIIAVGDPHQLCPPMEEEFGAIFPRFDGVELTGNHRSSGKAIICTAKAVLDGEPPVTTADGSVRMIHEPVPGVATDWAGYDAQLHGSDMIVAGTHRTCRRLNAVKRRALGHQGWLEPGEPVRVVTRALHLPKHTVLTVLKSRLHDACQLLQEAERRIDQARRNPSLGAGCLDTLLLGARHPRRYLPLMVDPKRLSYSTAAHKFHGITLAAIDLSDMPQARQDPTIGGHRENAALGLVAVELLEATDALNSPNTARLLPEGRVRVLQHLQRAARERGVPWLHACYGHAYTCHAAQGSEADHVLVVNDRHNKLADRNRAEAQHNRSWTYTALSRARVSVVMVADTRPMITPRGLAASFGHPRQPEAAA